MNEQNLMPTSDHLGPQHPSSASVLESPSTAMQIWKVWLISPLFNYKAKSRLKVSLMASSVFLFVYLLPASRMHAWTCSHSSSLCWERQAAD